MRLLVSVRAGHEVAAALAGGADIIDAKEPARGSLGPVAPEVLRAISARVPESVPLSVALGDFTAPDAVRHAVAGADAAWPSRPDLREAGIRGRAIRGRCDLARRRGARCRGRDVGPADRGAGRVRRPRERGLARARRRARARRWRLAPRAFLLDTYMKDGRGLLDWIDLDRLRALVGGRAVGGVAARDRRKSGSRPRSTTSPASPMWSASAAPRVAVGGKGRSTPRWSGGSGSGCEPGRRRSPRRMSACSQAGWPIQGGSGDWQNARPELRQEVFRGCPNVRHERS